LVSKESKLKDVSYLEILISSFLEHEKNLNDLIIKLEKTVEKISGIIEEIQRDEEIVVRSKNDLVLIKIKDNIPLEERKRIQKVLN